MAHAGGVDSTVLTTQYDLACLHFNAGNVNKSLELHQTVLGKRIQICGNGSQLSLESYEAVGIIHHLLGHHNAAR